MRTRAPSPKRAPGLEWCKERSNPMSPRGGPSTPLAESIVAGISAVLALRMIGLMIYEVVTSTGSPPRVEVEVVDITPAPGATWWRSVHTIGAT
jgi:hypothetical protein